MDLTRLYAFRKILHVHLEFVMLAVMVVTFPENRTVRVSRAGGSDCSCPAKPSVSRWHRAA